MAVAVGWPGIFVRSSILFNLGTRSAPNNKSRNHHSTKTQLSRRPGPYLIPRSLLSGGTILASKIRILLGSSGLISTQIDRSLSGRKLMQGKKAAAIAAKGSLFRKIEMFNFARTVRGLCTTLCCLIFITLLHPSASAQKDFQPATAKNAKQSVEAQERREREVPERRRSCARRRGPARSDRLAFQYPRRRAECER